MGQKVPIHPLLFPVYENITFVPGCSSKISPVRILKTTQAEKQVVQRQKISQLSKPNKFSLKTTLIYICDKLRNRKLYSHWGQRAEIFGTTFWLYDLIDEKLISIIVIIMFMQATNQFGHFYESACPNAHRAERGHKQDRKGAKKNKVRAKRGQIEGDGNST